MSDDDVKRNKYPDEWLVYKGSRNVQKVENQSNSFRQVSASGQPIEINLLEPPSSDNHNDEKEEISIFNDVFDIEDRLDEKLKKFGLTRRNAKTIIHVSKNLRSKEKKLVLDRFKFTELELPEDDDEEDEEYCPEKHKDMDMTADTECSQDVQEGIFIEDDCANSNDSFLAKLQQCDSDIQAIQQSSEKEIIALRTRSKYSLMDMAIAEIETSFIPPDVTEDMYKPSGDEAWHKWLAELMLDDAVVQPGAVDDDDCDKDPDYNFLQSDSEEVNDKEDYRRDYATYIPKKEVQELLEERNLPTINYQGHLQTQFSSKFRLIKSKPIQKFFSSSNTVRDQLNVKRTNYPLNKSSTSSLKNELVSSTNQLSHIKENNFDFTQEQSKILCTQIRQHVQLLVQLNLLCRNISTFSTIVLDTHALLKELQQLVDYNKKSFNISSSYFEVPYLSEAINIIELDVKKSSNIAKIAKSSRGRGLVPIQRNVGVLMAISSVFTYSSLLPAVAPSELNYEQSRVTFTSSEDCLLVLGMSQMLGFALPWSFLVHQYMMPCKLPEQLKTRFSNSYIRSDLNNPFRLYKLKGALPSSPPLCLPSVGIGTNIDSLLHYNCKFLPLWLLTLQNEYKSLTNLDIICKGMVKTHVKSSAISTSSFTQQQPCTVVSCVEPFSILLPTFISAQVHPILQQSFSHRTILLPKTTTLMQNTVQQLSQISTSLKSSISFSKQKKKTKKNKSSVKEKLHTDFQPICKDAEIQTSTVNIDDEDETITTEDDFEDEVDFHPLDGVYEISEEEDHQLKQEDNKRKKNLKAKWKAHKYNSSKQLGGRLHRFHPSLTRKRKLKMSDNVLSKCLRHSAEKVKLLEEESIVQLDPLRVEKEMLFAQSYLKRIEETLHDHPEIFVKVLKLMLDFDSDVSQTPAALFKKLSKVLQPWPDLIQGFAPFLLPEQAHTCGLLAEQQVYAKSRKFLRQLEIRFQDNSSQLQRILDGIKTMAENGIYKVQDVKNTLLSFLKCDPYLQEEFLMFFDDERPPESRLYGEYEEVVWNEDFTKEVNSLGFEDLHLLSIGENTSAINEMTTDNISSPVQQSTLKSTCKQTYPIIKLQSTEIKDVYADQGNSLFALSESRLTNTEEGNGLNKETSTSRVLDIAVISEDALSSSPFSHHNPIKNRPKTPTHDVIASQDELSIFSVFPSASTSSLGTLPPPTPTGSKLSADEQYTSKPWTFEDDNLLLSLCKKRGLSDEVFNELSSLLHRSVKNVTVRFKHLMSLLGEKECNDTDTTNHHTDSESEVSEE